MNAKVVYFIREALKTVGGDALARHIFQKKADDCMDAGGRATQEQLPSLHVVNEHFFGKFNDARASEVIFQSFLSNIDLIFLFSGLCFYQGHGQCGAING